MKKLKLNIIEEGRMNIEEMNEITGGTHCGYFVSCTSGKSTCSKYWDCTLWNDYCGTYKWASLVGIELL